MHSLVFDTKFRGAIFCKLLKKNPPEIPEFRLLGTAKSVTFFNAFNHFLINANLGILSDDLNA
jgi:hypothetical protein